MKAALRYGYARRETEFTSLGSQCAGARSSSSSGWESCSARRATLVALLDPVAARRTRPKERDGIDLVFWFTTAICIAIFALVGAVILYSVVKFRVRPDDDSDGPPIHGHTGVEIVWTAVPAILVTAISVISGIVLVQNDSAGKNHLNVERDSPGSSPGRSRIPSSGDLTSAQLRLPVDRSVELHLTAARRDPLVLGAASSARSRTPCPARTRSS